jgi:hypothetical protein
LWAHPKNVLSIDGKICHMMAESWNNGSALCRVLFWLATLVKHSGLGTVSGSEFDSISFHACGGAVS